MEALLNSIELTSGEFTQIIILALVLLVGLFVLRVAFKLTASLFRLGCLGVLFILAAFFVLNLLN